MRKSLLTTDFLIGPCNCQRSFMEERNIFTSEMAASREPEIDVLMKDFEKWQAETGSENIFLLEVKMVVFSKCQI